MRQKGRANVGPAGAWAMEIGVDGREVRSHQRRSPGPLRQSGGHTFGTPDEIRNLLTSAKYRNELRKLVPRGGIEPPTP
mgnify:CR=1 FL=1